MINPTPIEVNNQIRLCQVREGTTRFSDEIRLLKRMLDYNIKEELKARINKYLKSVNG